MPAASKDTVNKQADAAGEEAPAAEAAKRYVVKEGFHAYIETQLVKFEKGDELDKNVSDWLLSHNGESHIRELD